MTKALTSLLLRYLVPFWIGLASLPAMASDGDGYTVLLYGDSIAAGLGLERSEAIEGQLEAALKAKGLEVTVANGGVSGDTTAGGLARVGWTPSDNVNLVILILGGNDALRGLTPEQSEANLDALLTDFERRGVRVLLTGMRAPPNLGPEYAAAFEPMFKRLSEKHDIPLYPFILEGVAGDLSLNQPDGIHPNAEGVKVIVANLVPFVTLLLGS